MKQFIQKYAKVLWLTFLLLVTLVTVTISYAQGEPIVPPVEFPVILFIPYILGVFSHWMKKYTFDGLTLNFFSWIVQNWGWTTGSLIAGMMAVWAIFGSSPGAFVPVTIGSWLIVFNTAVTADTINSAGTKNPTN